MFGFLRRPENVQNEFVAAERGKPRFYAAFGLVVLFSRKFPMNDNHLQTGGMEVVVFFTRFLGL